MEKRVFLEKVLAHGRKEGFAACEVFYRGRKSFEVRTMQGEVIHYENSKEEGVSFRGNMDGCTGYAYTEEITEEAISTLVQTAKENAALLLSEDVEEISDAEADYPQVKGVNENLEQVTVAEKIDAAKKMERAALAKAEEIASLQDCVVGTSLSEIAILNTKGLDISFAKNVAVAYASAIASRGGETKTGTCFWKGQDWSAFVPEQVGEDAAQEALNCLGAVSVPSGKYDVLLEGKAMVLLLQAFVGVFFAENVQEGFSLLQGKKGLKIAAEKVTLRDDALKIGGYATQPFDHEGVLGKNKTVIEKGILQTFLYHKKAAKKDGVPSTGNGFKLGLAGKIKTAPTNFYIENGAITQEALCCQLREGIWIRRLMGLPAGTNMVSGDFSLLAEGFYVAEGKQKYPIEQITIAGNFYQLLLAIEEIADDLYFGTSGIGAPSVLIRNMDIAGK